MEDSSIKSANRKDLTDDIWFNQKERSLSVWVLDGDWHTLRKDIKLHDWLAEVESQFFDGCESEVESQLFDGCESGEEDWMEEIEVVGFSPVDKDVVILRYNRYVWAYDTRNRVYEQLCHPSSLRSNFPSARHLSTSAFVLKPRPTILPPVSSE
ncbi:uncharacterized protein LOC113288614 [Papaver somniferum]|uniref:uncharacterized protein LOC113288614 n=1 Tax=Papaver somniferum TaxID=3469 RepID=UPI000E6F6586|nr:uncharacterized protein LOC113288614 [Papaver somniferum]